LAVLGREVERNVDVDQNGDRSVVSCQRHDGVRSHRDIAASSQMGHQAASSAIPGPRGGRNYAHDVAVEFELHLGIWHKACLFADFDWDCDLTFRGDTHGVVPNFV
jgi:hypothetical protein